MQVGLINGPQATATVVAIHDSGEVELGFNQLCWKPPLAKIPIDLLLALPRPKVIPMSNKHLIANALLCPQIGASDRSLAAGH